MKNKLYLVTGATGFLGNNVCRRLAEKGMRIRALVMNGDPAEKYLPGGVETIHGDLLESSSLCSASHLRLRACTEKDISMISAG